MAVITELRSIAGLLPVSMVDWEGKLASVLFMKGCNLRCPYCHNPELVRTAETAHLSWDEVISQLREKKGWVDGVVITGGEPAISPELPDIVKRIRAEDFGVKLDTNGTNPEVLTELLDESALDYVALDIKAPFDIYDKVSKVSGMAEPVRRSVEAIISSGVDHEFRTTVVPGFFEPQALLEVARYLGESGGRRYYIQQFNPDTVLDESLAAVRPYPSGLLETAAADCCEFLPTKARGRL